MNGHEQTFSGSAYHPDLGNEMAHGEIFFDTWTLHFQSETVNVDLPLQDLQIHVSDNDTRVLFMNPQQPDWSVYASDSDILEHRVFLRTALRQQLQQIAERTHNWRRLLYITLGAFTCFMLLALVIFQLTGWTLNYLVNKVPIKYEAQLGDKTLKELQQQADFVQDKKKIAALTSLGQKILPPGAKDKFNFRYHIIDYPLPNAFALPGGNLIVTTGLLEMSETPEQLAGVLAHESGHVIKRHGLRHIISTVGPYLVLSTFFQDKDGFFGLLGQSTHLLITSNFSQTYENEADDAAWDYLLGANVNPHSYIDALEKLKAETEAFEVKQIQAFRSHPPTSDRIQRLEEKWNKLKNKSGFVQLEDHGLK